MRIALLAPLVSPIADPPEGGSQAVVADVARGLAARGHDVVLYAARGSRVAGVRLATLDIDSAQLRADRYRHDASAPPSEAMIAAYRTLYSHLCASSWDVIHNHGFDAPAVTEPARRGVTALHTLHLPPSPALVAAIAEARALTPAAWFAGVSASHAAAWSKFTTLDGVLPNGVPVHLIPFGAVGARRALIAARFSREKGIAEGIAAARDAGWPVAVFAGPYDAGCEGEVRSRWASDGGVVFAGQVQREQLWAEMARAGVVLCLSRWDEPFGMVAAEAQAAGTPVVATGPGGFADVVADGVTGFIVARGAHGAAVDALRLVGTIDRKACRRRAEETLSLDRALDAHEAVYERWHSARA